MARPPPRVALFLNDLRLAVSIILSAFFYFFDFGTNICTAVTYYRIEYGNYSYSDPKKFGGDFENGRFAIILSIMIGAHIGSAVVFAFNVETRREAIKAAFLLPLLHLRRLGLLLWRKGSLRGVSGIASEELSSVYNVLAAAMEAAPQIFFQLVMLKSLIIVQTSWKKAGDFQKLPRELVISVVASFLSVIYNCSQATALAMRKANFKARALAGILSGVYSSSALVVRFIGIEALQNMVSYMGTLSAGMMMCSMYVFGTLVFPALIFWRASRGDGKSASPAKRLLMSIAFAYMSLLIGPLFALLSLTTITNRRRHHQHPSNGSAKSYHGKLLALSMVYILPDVLLFNLFLFKIFQGAQLLIQDATDGNMFFLENPRCHNAYFRDNYPCGDSMDNPFCGVGTVIGFDCAVAVHVVSIFLVISFDRYSKNKEDEEAEDRSADLRRGLVNENEICALETGEARISNSRRKFIYDRAQGCML